jgi:hypothetical protein
MIIDGGFGEMFLPKDELNGFLESGAYLAT